ncbi:Hypothetical predicted protein [Octopus vulgaris]|uniref:Uncharacterized protein n=1 Tax=Octopus vulgaris TaxID=6645 RepID=A0AA36F995_OCTVU|nr:Hypothetical predicted protein [Octopus vulgaris]
MWGGELIKRKTCLVKKMHHFEERLNQWTVLILCLTGGFMSDNENSNLCFQSMAREVAIASSFSYQNILLESIETHCGFIVAYRCYGGCEALK